MSVYTQSPGAEANFKIIRGTNCRSVAVGLISIGMRHNKNDVPIFRRKQQERHLNPNVDSIYLALLSHNLNRLKTR